MDIPVTSRAALLQVLIRGPGYGLSLIDRVKEHTNGKIALNQGSVYPALRDMEREGLVESYEGESTPERGGRPRIYYRITAEGLRAAHEQSTSVLALFTLAGARQ